MRAASWAFVVCAMISAMALLLPSLEIQVKGVSLGRRMSLSLYQANRQRDLIQGALASYHRAPGRGLGDAIARAIIPTIGGRAGAILADGRSALHTVDGVTDRDVASATAALRWLLWTVLALHVLMAGLMFIETMRARHRRSRVIVAMVLAVLVAAVAIAITLLCNAVVAAGNDELGASLLGLGVAAYLMPVAAVGAVLAGAVLLVKLRRPRATPIVPSSPPPA